jgi:hypothetical protein
MVPNAHFLLDFRDAMFTAIGDEDGGGENDLECLRPLLCAPNVKGVCS